jgi:hypothetical protein
VKQQSLLRKQAFADVQHGSYARRGKSLRIVEQENLHRLPAEQRNVRTAERAGACASARGSGLDYTRWFLKIGLYVYKYIILRRRKVVWGLGLQLFSGKWAVFWAFCRSEVAIRGAVRWPRENGA